MDLTYSPQNAIINLLKDPLQKDINVLILKSYAGTGKTTTIANTIAEIISSGLLPPQKLIYSITFTRFATQQISQKKFDLEKKLKNSLENYWKVMTIDSFIFSIASQFSNYLNLPKSFNVILRESNWGIIDDNTSYELLNLWYEENPKELEDFIKNTPYFINKESKKYEWNFTKILTHLIRKAINSQDEYDYQDIRKIQESEFKGLNQQNLSQYYTSKIIDLYFSCRTSIPLELVTLKVNFALEDETTSKKILTSESFPRINYLFIDEFQDISPLRWNILKKIIQYISKNGGKTIIIGDPLQSIYLKKEKDIIFMLAVKDELEKLSLNVVELPLLNTNYRSHPQIINYINNYLDKQIKKYINGGEKNESNQSSTSTNKNKKNTKFNSIRSALASYENQKIIPFNSSHNYDFEIQPVNEEKCESLEEFREKITNILLTKKHISSANPLTIGILTYKNEDAEAIYNLIIKNEEIKEKFHILLNADRKIHNAPITKALYLLIDHLVHFHYNKKDLTKKLESLDFESPPQLPLNAETSFEKILNLELSEESNESSYLTLKELCKLLYENLPAIKTFFLTENPLTFISLFIKIIEKLVSAPETRYQKEILLKVAKDALNNGITSLIDFYYFLNKSILNAEEILKIRAPEPKWQLLNQSYPETKPQIIITTIHKAKGLEYNEVIYIKFVQSKKNSSINKEEKLTLEEILLDYVAFTRAKNNLFIFEIEEDT